MIWRGLLSGLWLCGAALAQEARPVPEAFNGQWRLEPSEKPDTEGVEAIMYPDVMCLPGKTLIWNAVMQAAFDRCIGSKSPMVFEKVEPPHPTIERMRKFAWKEEDILPRQGWFAVAGPTTQALYQEANSKWQALTGNDDHGWSYNPDSPAQRLVAFMGLKRQFAYQMPLISDEMTWGEQPVKVRAFGAQKEDAESKRRMVRILAYHRSSRMKSVQILCCDDNDRMPVDDTMVLYMPEQYQTMWEAIQWLKQWQKAWPQREEARWKWDDKFLHREDCLRVPQILLKKQLKLDSQLSGRLFFRAQKDPWFIDSAQMDLKLGVDEQGVRFETRCFLSMTAFGVQEDPPQSDPRYFVFNRPFFLFLWRDGAEWPYAGVWFGNADAFVK